MSKFCGNCGKELEPGTEVCPNCGKFVEVQEPVQSVQSDANQQTSTSVPVKVPGKGMSTAGMVLGIVACVWTLLAVLSLPTVGLTIDEMLGAYSAMTSTSYVLFWFGVGYTFFSFLPALVGLPLSIAGLVKHKSGKNITGLILNSVALLSSVAMIIYIMSYK